MRPGSLCVSRERGYPKYAAEINRVITISFQRVPQWNVGGFWVSQGTHKWFVQPWWLIWGEDSLVSHRALLLLVVIARPGGPGGLPVFLAFRKPVCESCMGLRAYLCPYRGDEGEEQHQCSPAPLPGPPPFPWPPCPGPEKGGGKIQLRQRYSCGEHPSPDSWPDRNSNKTQRG